MGKLQRYLYTFFLVLSVILTINVVNAGGDSGCNLQPTYDALETVTGVEQGANACKNHANTLKKISSKVKSYYSRRKSLASMYNTFNNTVNGLDSAINFIQPALEFLQPYGRAAKSLRNSMTTARDNLSFLSGDVDKLQSNIYRAGNATEFFKYLKNQAYDVKLRATIYHTKMSVAATQSEDRDKCGSCTINEYSENRNYFWEGLHAVVSTCETELDLPFEVTIPDIDDSAIQEAIDKIEEAISEIEDFINNVVGFFEKIVEKVEGEANYFMCCNSFGQGVGLVLESLTDTFNVATCWADALLDQTMGEILDVLFSVVQDVLDETINPIAEELSDAVSKMDTIAVDVPSLNSFGYPSAEYRTVEGSCHIEFEGPTLEFSVERLEPTLDIPGTIELDADGSFDIEDIGNAIAEACEDAWDALTEVEALSCCESARVRMGYPPEGKKIGADCAWPNECELRRCDPRDGAFSGKICKVPLPNCSDGCNEDLDCENGKCMNEAGGNGSCAGSDGKICLNKNCANNGQCSTGRCEFYSGLKKKCMNKVDNCGDCSENSDCKNGNCMNEAGGNGSCAGSDGKICLNKNCANNGQCSTGRCEFYSGSKKKCMNKVANCGGCSENSDCKNNKCMNPGNGNGSCAGSDGKICLNKNCATDGQCSTGRCDPYSGMLKKCMNKVGSCGGCNENSDCSSGRCKHGTCTYSNGKICNGKKCSSNGECSTGRCDLSGGQRICMNKLNKGSRCTENSDCKSNSCKANKWGGKKYCQ